MAGIVPKEISDNAFMLAIVAIVVHSFIVEIPYALGILAILGILVGMADISGAERVPWILSVIALSLIGLGGIANVPIVGGMVGEIYNAISESLFAFAGSATAVVALQTMYDIVQK